ncbi:MAG: beta-mannosidase [Thermoguttaceae bacterium]
MRSKIPGKSTRLVSFFMLFVVTQSVSSAWADGVARLDLGGAWQVVQEGAGETIPAIVPGCIHTDLLAAKKIPDPFFRDNERAVQWVGEANWLYRRSLDVAPELLAHDYVVLKCEGLDTLATIRLNDAVVAHTDNMFRTYEFDVKKLLKPGNNTLEIKFDSVLPSMRAKEARRKLPTWAYPGAGYVRKEPCNFGWDWGPTLITCGIWRNIGIEAFNAARLDEVAILQDHSKQGAVALNIQVAAHPASDDLQVKTEVFLGGQRVAGGLADLAQGKAKIDVAIDNPQLWWPAGMGKQPLYRVQVDLLRGGKLLDSTTKRIGLRTLRAVPQTAAAPLHFEVNGIPFFAKGANWIPADCFANRLTKEVYRRYVDDAVAANMNTLRFWGGGYYEDDALFDLCDEKGICIWLDLKFGCSTYPAFDDAFLKSVTAEARDNIVRLRHHPSIALWCGNNEIMFFRGGKQWTDDKMSDGDYYKLFRDTLGEQIHRLAPQSDYVTGSPDCGDVHFWEVWHGGKPFEVYRDIHGFVSEFGFQSFPAPKTVDSFTTAADRNSVYSPVMMYHERSNRMYMDVKEDGRIGTDKIMILVRKYFREPKDFESTLWLSQITQGYGIKYGAEGWRRESPKSMGCVYWQYNDCWPCSSWSSVDYFGRWKALQYMARRFYAPVLVSGDEDVKGRKVDLHVTSDRLENCQGSLQWTITDVSGVKLGEGKIDVDIAAGKSRLVRSLELRDVVEKQGEKNILVWLKLDVAGETVSENLVTLAYPRELKLLDPALSADITEKGQGLFTVVLHAEHPALWTWLELDGVDARFSDNFVHVGPAGPVTITVQPAMPMTKDALQRALKIRSLYDTYK